MTWRRMFFGSLFLLGWVTVGMAQPGDDAKRALEKAANFPWYDADQGELREVGTPEPGTPPVVRDWEWPKLGKWNWDGWDWGGFSFGDLVGTIFQIVAWTLLIGLLVTVVLLLIRAYMEGEGFSFRVNKGTDDAIDVRSDAERIENLPFDVKVAKTDLLAEAKRLRAEGRFGDALVYLFSYQLVQLDRHHFIRLTRGKTNRQYLREVATRHDLKRVLGVTMVAFEDFFFGDHAIGKDRFESLWQQLDEFHGIVGSAEVTTG